MDFVDILQQLIFLAVAFKMKIFVNARFLTQPVSGVQRYGIECSRQIKKLYPDSVFLAPGNIIHKDIARELDAQIIGYNTGHLWEQADLFLYLLGAGQPPLFSPANTAPLLYRNNYLTLHDLAFYHHPEWNTKAFSAWYNFMVPRLVHSSRHIFTVSQTIRNEITKYYKVVPSKISVTYNGISASMLSFNEQKQEKKEKTILSVGTFSKRKNHQNLVKAFVESRIKDEYQLVIIGDKNKVFAETGLDGQLFANTNIKIYDRLSTEELISIYLRSEVLVSLSVYEGFGIPILEGLYSGCKVICSDIEVYRELYDGYVTFCDPYDTANISAALNSITTGNEDYRPENIGRLLNKYNYTESAKVIIDQIKNNVQK